MALLHLIFTATQADGAATGWNIAGCCGRKRKRSELRRVSHKPSNSPLMGQTSKVAPPKHRGRAGSKILLGSQKAECWTYLMNRFITIPAGQALKDGQQLGEYWWGEWKRDGDKKVET